MKLLHPAYFPNIAFFTVMVKNDIIWETKDNYQKQTYRNRTYICTDRGKHMLSIPIVHVGTNNGRQAYKEVRVDNTYPWQRQHWRTLETAYRTSPFFEFYEDDIKPLYEQKFEYLMDFNLKTVTVICDFLQIQMPTNKTDEYQLKPKNLEDYRFLVNSKNNLKNTELPNYVQVFGDRHGFVPNLSILDLLFSLGPETTAYLKTAKLNVSHA